MTPPPSRPKDLWPPVRCRRTASPADDVAVRRTDVRRSAAQTSISHRGSGSCLGPWASARPAPAAPHSDESSIRRTRTTRSARREAHQLRAGHNCKRAPGGLHRRPLMVNFSNYGKLPHREEELARSPESKACAGPERAPPWRMKPTVVVPVTTGWPPNLVKVATAQDGSHVGNHPRSKKLGSSGALGRTGWARSSSGLQLCLRGLLSWPLPGLKRLTRLRGARCPLLRPDCERGETSANQPLPRPFYPKPDIRQGWQTLRGSLPNSHVSGHQRGRTVRGILSCPAGDGQPTTREPVLPGSGERSGAPSEVAGALGRHPDTGANSANNLDARTALGTSVGA